MNLHGNDFWIWERLGMSQTNLQKSGNDCQRIYILFIYRHNPFVHWPGCAPTQKHTLTRNHLQYCGTMLAKVSKLTAFSCISCLRALGLYDLALNIKAWCRAPVPAGFGSCREATADIGQRCIGGAQGPVMIPIRSNPKGCVLPIGSDLPDSTLWKLNLNHDSRFTMVLLLWVFDTLDPSGVWNWIRWLLNGNGVICCSLRM